MGWLDLIRAQGPLLVNESAHHGSEGSTGEGRQAEIAVLLQYDSRGGMHGR